MPLEANSGCHVGGIPNFQKYSAVYDLLYRDKDYASEANYIAQRINTAVPNARDILELGSGTGRHGRLLAAKGFRVHGIERSADMAALANSAAVGTASAGSFQCQVGDLRAVALPYTFDAAISLFHVISYQTTDDDLRAGFATAARHLKPGGIFLFDVWHGPAVLAQQPERRVKKVADENLEVVRTARPQLDPARGTVKVAYDIVGRDRRSGELMHFSEDHLMRYLFPNEIENLARQNSMQITVSEEFMTGRPPSPSTWSVFYMLRKSAE
jgi:SAM-dependent methyltransferase